MFARNSDLPFERDQSTRFLPWIVGTLAAVRGVTPEELAAQTTANARRFFRLSQPVRQVQRVPDE